VQVDKQEAASGVRGDKALAPVLDNSLGWGSFMLVSSNTRYQIVNTLEERLLVRRVSRSASASHQRCTHWHPVRNRCFA